MPSASTVRMSAVGLCVLLACSACSQRRSFVRNDGPGPVPSQVSLPGSVEDLGRNIRTDPAVIPASHRPDSSGVPTPRRRRRFSSRCQAAQCKIWTDHENYYRWDVARDLLLAVSGASLLANTSMDQDFQDWYRNDVASRDTEHFADACKTFGEGQIFIPAFLGLALVGGLCDHTACGSVVGELGSRTTRGYLVGAPPMLFMQYALGASRPGETVHESRWKPFDDNNAVSGHAFIGAVPFITAAKMAENPCLKGGLYLCSTLTAWSRVEHDSHYLSQAILGWWMAYLASSAVDKTERDYDHLTLTPVATPEMVGIGVLYER